jgi:hypothetical protein
VEGSDQIIQCSKLSGGFDVQAAKLEPIVMDQKIIKEKNEWPN